MPERATSERPVGERAAGGRTAPSGLRAQKRRQTRAAILDAACDLFAEHGYHGTTLTGVAAAAGIAPRTFFGYFPTKESLLFPESQDRIDIAVAAVLEAPGSPDDPVTALLDALDTALRRSDDMTGRLATVRTQLLRDDPEVGLVGAKFQYRAAQEITRGLVRRYPTMTPVEARALAGAFVGAASGAVVGALESHATLRHDQVPAAIRSAVARVLKPGAQQ